MIMLWDKKKFVSLTVPLVGNVLTARSAKLADFRSDDRVIVSLNIFNELVYVDDYGSNERPIPDPMPLQWSQELSFLHRSGCPAFAVNEGTMMGWTQQLAKGQPWGGGTIDRYQVTGGGRHTVMIQTNGGWNPHINVEIGNGGTENNKKPKGKKKKGIKGIAGPRPTVPSPAPTPAPVPQEETVTIAIPYVSCRGIKSRKGNKVVFNDERSDVVDFGIAYVKVPKSEFDEDEQEARKMAERRMQAPPQDDSDVEFVSVGSDQRSFLDSVRELLKKSGGRDIWVTGHGFNSPAPFVIRWNAKLQHYVSGIVIAFLWPSLTQASTYLTSELNGRWASKHYKDKLLEALITEFEKQLQDHTYDIHLLYHSQGGHLAEGALPRLSLELSAKGDRRKWFKTAILASLDVDRDPVSDWGPLVVERCDRVFVLQSSKDKVLMVSRQIHGGKYRRLGEVDSAVPPPEVKEMFWYEFAEADKTDNSPGSPPRIDVGHNMPLWFVSDLGTKRKPREPWCVVVLRSGDSPYYKLTKSCNVASSLALGADYPGISC
jgi:esterase/lipase superfamily enzyme